MPCKVESGWNDREEDYVEVVLQESLCSEPVTCEMDDGENIETEDDHGEDERDGHDSDVNIA